MFFKNSLLSADRTKLSYTISNAALWFSVGQACQAQLVHTATKHFLNWDLNFILLSAEGCYTIRTWAESRLFFESLSLTFRNPLKSAVSIAVSHLTLAEMCSGGTGDLQRFCMAANPHQMISRLLYMEIPPLSKGPSGAHYKGLV